jgi:hypothetical protein
MPPKILQLIHNCCSRRLPKPVSRLIAGCLALLVIPCHCSPIAISPEVCHQATRQATICGSHEQGNSGTHHQKALGTPTRSSIDCKNKPLQAGWAMKWKQLPGTGAISKYKACLNAHGGQQEEGVNCWDTYAPVVCWMSVRMMLILNFLAEGLQSRSIDFTLAYPQAGLNVNIFLELPHCFRLKGFDKKDFVRKLHKNLYGLKQAGYNWFEKLRGGMEQRGFTPYHSDPCVYTKQELVVLVYVDNLLIFLRSMRKIERFIHSLDNKYEIHR